ncbi:MAG: RidA family protein [Sphingomonadaceae bacterium]
MSAHRILQPPGWPRPKGYANGIAGKGLLVFTAGMVGWDEGGRFVGDGMAEQFAQALKNMVAVLAEAGAGPGHVARMTCYVTSRAEYLKAAREIGVAWQQVMGDHYPAMALVEVAALVEAEAKVEIEATAVVPE